MKFRNLDCNLYSSTCPGCGKSLRWCKHGSIKVNIHSKQDVDIDNFFELTQACENPICEWSKLVIEE